MKASLDIPVYFKTPMEKLIFSIKATPIKGNLGISPKSKSAGKTTDRLSKSSARIDGPAHLK